MTDDEIIEMAREAGFAWDRMSILCGPMRHLVATVAARAAAEEREACVDIIERYRIPVDNSAAGEMAFGWTYDALHTIRDDIRARGQEVTGADK